MNDTKNGTRKFTGAPARRTNFMFEQERGDPTSCLTTHCNFILRGERTLCLCIAVQNSTFNGVNKRARLWDLLVLL